MRACVQIAEHAPDCDIKTVSISFDWQRSTVRCGEALSKHTNDHDRQHGGLTTFSVCRGGRQRCCREGPVLVAATTLGGSQADHGAFLDRPASPEGVCAPLQPFLGQSHRSHFGCGLRHADMPRANGHFRGTLSQTHFSHSRRLYNLGDKQQCGPTNSVQSIWCRWALRFSRASPTRSFPSPR